MNDPQAQPPAPKKGLSGLAIAGIGCGTLLLISGIAGGLLIMKGCQKFKEVAGDLKDFEKNPTKATALMMLKLNPELEVLNVNDATGEITVKEKKSGNTITMSFDDIANGKFTMKNEKGEVVTVDAANGGKDGLVVNGPDGKTVVGGAQSAPPDWVPLYPGATQTGGMKSEKGETINGSFSTETADPVAKVKEYYDGKLKSEGYESTITSNQSEGNELVMISGTKEEGKRTVTVMIQSDSGKTHVALTYGFEPTK